MVSHHHFPILPETEIIKVLFGRKEADDFTIIISSSFGLVQVQSKVLFIASYLFQGSPVTKDEACLDHSQTKKEDTKDEGSVKDEPQREG